LSNSSFVIRSDFDFEDITFTIDALQYWRNCGVTFELLLIWNKWSPVSGFINNLYGIIKLLYILLSAHAFLASSSSLITVATSPTIFSTSSIKIVKIALPLVSITFVFSLNLIIRKHQKIMSPISCKKNDTVIFI